MWLEGRAVKWGGGGHGFPRGRGCRAAGRRQLCSTAFILGCRLWMVVASLLFVDSIGCVGRVAGRARGGREQVAISAGSGGRGGCSDVPHTLPPQHVSRYV